MMGPKAYYNLAASVFSESSGE